MKKSCTLLLLLFLAVTSLWMLSSCDDGESNEDGDTDTDGDTDQAGESEENSDSEGEVQEEGDIDGDDDAEQSGESNEEEEGVQLSGSMIEFAYHHICPGCTKAPPCNLSSNNNDSRGLTFLASPSTSETVLIASERYEAFARSLEIDTCRILTNSDQEQLEVPKVFSTLNAGNISIDADWQEWSETATLEFLDSSGNYNAAILFYQHYGYDPTGQMTLSAEGGPDIDSFSVTGQPVVPIVLLSPSVDSEGNFPSIPKDQPLELMWSGADGIDEVYVQIDARWCNATPSDNMLCRLANDGQHTISADLIGEMDWGNMATLVMHATRRMDIPLSEELPNDQWSIRADVSLYIHDDPDAEQVIPQDCGPMEEGYVGMSCTDDNECGGGCCLQEVNGILEGNYCSIPNCSPDSECPADSVCFNNHHLTLPYETYCALKCTEDSDCRMPAYFCDHSAGSICIPNFW